MSNHHQPPYFSKWWMPCWQDLLHSLMTSLLQMQPRTKLLKLLVSVSEWIQQYGFQFRAEKCQFFQTSTKYIGLIFDQTCQWPNPENISAIKTKAAQYFDIRVFSMLGKPLQFLFARTAPYWNSPELRSEKGCSMELVNRLPVCFYENLIFTFFGFVSHTL